MPDINHKEILSRNLQYYMTIHNKRQSDLVKDLGFKASTISNWYKGIMMPRMNAIQRLADYFSINVSQLIEEDKKIERTNENFNNSIDNMSKITMQNLDKILYDDKLSEIEAGILRARINIVLIKLENFVKDYIELKPTMLNDLDYLKQSNSTEDDDELYKKVKRKYLDKNLESQLQSIVSNIYSIPDFLSDDKLF